MIKKGDNLNLKKLGTLLLCSLLISAVALSGCLKNTESEENTATIVENDVNTKADGNEHMTISSNKKVVPSTNEGEEYITIKDMWNREVKINKDVNRVVLLGFSGMYLRIMKVWNIEDKVVGIDTITKKDQVLKVLCPRLENITDVGGGWGGVNYEAIAATEPDLVIIRPIITNKESEEKYKKIIDRLNEMNISVVILLHPSSYDTPNIDTAWQEIEILGKIFNKEKESKDLINNLNGYVELVRKRTENVPEDERPRVLLYLPPDYMLGGETIQSYFLEDILHGKNVVERGKWVKTSPEEILELNPDVIILLGHMRYISPEEVYSGKKIYIDWKLVQDVKAIKERRVGSLGRSEWGITLEFPIGLLKMAKTAYPEKFNDIDLEKEEIKFYKKIYGLNDKEIKKVMEAQRYKGKIH